MTTVTKLAGLSLGLVNFHFKSKNVLLEETLRFLAEEHRDQWLKGVSKQGLSPQAKLQAIVDAQFHPSICSRKKLTVWFAFFGEAAYRKSYRTITTRIDTERMEVLTSLCSRIIAEGGYDVSAENTTKTLEGLFDGFWLNMLMYPAKYSRTVSIDLINTYLSTTFPDHFERGTA